MSTKFGILTEEVEHNKLVDNDGDLHFYISKTIFEPVFFRGNNSRWLVSYGEQLSNETKVYALDNTQQGIFTIGDIKKFMKEHGANS
jgi:hypothetical protein